MAYNKAEKTDSSMKRRAPRRRKKVLRILWREQRRYRLQERCNVKEVCFRERKDPSEKNYRNLCKASESNDRSYQESSSYRTYAIYSRVIRYKNKKSGVRTRLLKGAHESALLFSYFGMIYIF